MSQIVSLLLLDPLVYLMISFLRASPFIRMIPGLIFENTFTK